MNNPTLTLPFELAMQIFETLADSPNSGWQGADEQNMWTIGRAFDEETGLEFLQIICSPKLYQAKG